jgi:hypothetical protein
VRLATVLDDQEAVSIGDLHQRRHVGRLTVQMHRHDGLRPRRDRGSCRGGGQRQPVGIDIGKHRPRADHHDRQRGVGRRYRCGDDFVTGAHVERPQRQRERIRAGVHADGVDRIRCGGELLFECLELGAEHEPPARDDALDGGPDVGRVAAGHEAEERNHSASR